jgi:hypothetical protein
MHVHTLTKKVENLQHEGSLLEEEVDNLTRTRTCLQGYVKNEIELSENYKTMTSIYLDALNTLYVKCMLCFYLTIFMYIVVGCITHTELRLTLLCIYVPSSAYYSAKELRRIRRKYLYDDDILNVKETINRIEKNNTYIQDLVDSI